MFEPDAAEENVYSISSLEDLGRLPSLRLAPARVGVRLAIPGLDEPQRVDMERRLAKNLAACGCNEGGVALMLYLILVPILAVAGPLAPHSVLGWIALFGGLIVVSLLGKAVGLALARLRLNRLVDKLEDAFPRTPLEA